MKQKMTLGLLVSFLITLTACGGGGGGGNNSGDTTTSYTGVTTAAQIDTNNSKDIAGGATSMGTFGGGNVVASVDTGTSEINTGTSIISRAASKAILDKLNSPNIATVGTVVNDSATGACGGTLSISMDINDTTHTFNGSLSFNSYCEDSVTVTGSATITGQVNASATQASFKMTIGSLLVKEQKSGSVYKIENYVIDITANSSTITVSVSGRFYHPQYGYVSVTTPYLLYYSISGAWPYTGSVKVAEVGGTNSATLTAMSSTQYQLVTNIGGKVTLTTGNWTDL